jgi:hypothetical protein
MRRIPKHAIVWTLECLPEDIPVKGNCSAIDPKTDRAEERRIMSELDNGNQWAWCCVKVSGEYRGLTADTYLGCCSFEDEAAFTAPGGYYDDMVNEVWGLLTDKRDRVLHGNA